MAAGRVAAFGGAGATPGDGVRHAAMPTTTEAAASDA